MQKGLAMLEVIFAVMIIAMLMRVMVPNTARVLDRAALDYEYKKLYSDLRFLQTISRAGDFDDEGMANDATVRAATKSASTPYMEIYTDRGSWKILRDNPSVLGRRTNIREEHILSQGIKISSPQTTIQFKMTGRTNLTSGAITLTSRFGRSNKIVFDSVGRFRGER